MCYVIPRICTVDGEFTVNRQIMKLFNVHDDLIKWSKHVWNLNLDLRNQKQVLSIVKHCLVR